MISIGFIYFIDEGNIDYMENNIIAYCYSDKYKFQKIKNIYDLDQSVLWVSNKKENTVPFIKPCYYLGFSIENIIYFLNLKISEINRNIHLIYFVLKNSIIKINNHYKVDFESDSLSRDIFNNFKVSKIRFNQDKIQDFIKERKDVIISTEGLKKKGNKIALSFLDYYEIRNICKNKMPLGNWKRTKIIPSKNNKEVKFIIKVKVVESKKWLSDIISKNYSEDGMWIIGEEFFFLKEVGAKIKILDAYYSDAVFYLKDIEPNKLFKIKPEENNISNYISSLVYMNSFKNKNSIINAWLSQLDKVNMLKVSFVLSSFDIEVVAFGNNMIIVNTENNIDKIIKISNKIGLNYPLSIL